MTQKAAITSYDRTAFMSMTPTIADRWKLLAKAPMLMTLPVSTTTDKKHNWVEDIPFTYQTALSATASAAAVTFNVTAGTGPYFMPGAIVLTNSEIVKVTSVSTDALTVVRAQQGTTGAIQSATGSALYIIGNAQLEGATTPTGTYTVKVDRVNYCQIFQTPVKVTGSDDAIAGPGGNQYEYTKRREEWNHYVLLDKAIKYNKDTKTGAASTLRYMKGLLGWLSATTYAITSSTIGGTSTSTAITKAKIDKFLGILKANGGSEWACYCGLTAYQAVQDAMIANSQKPIAVAGETASTNGFVFSRYVCGYGVVTFIMDQNARTGDMFFIEISDEETTGTIVKYLRPSFYQENAVTGDFKNGVWITEVTLEQRNGSCSGIITSVASGS